MKYFAMISFWIFAFPAVAQSPTNAVCEKGQEKLHKMIAEATACHHDSDCIITQKFSDKLQCGKNMAIHKKADLKRILSVADSIKFCAGGGSCYHQDAKQTLTVKCIEQECQIIE